METVDVLVQIWDRGQSRKAVVQVQEECFAKDCWKPIACMMAATELDVPFTTVLRIAKYGLRMEDKQRLFGQCKAAEDSSLCPG